VAYSNRRLTSGSEAREGRHDFDNTYTNKLTDGEQFEAFLKRESGVFETLFETRTSPTFPLFLSELLLSSLAVFQ